MNLSEQATQYIKQNKKILFEKFANEELFKSVDSPSSFFMAGSPGAGKTEFSKRFLSRHIEEKKERNSDYNVIRIDADDIREILPGYTGSNSHLFQSAVSLGVNELYSFVLKKKINVLVDGTFSSEKYAMQNIERSLKRGRFVFVLALD